MVMLGRFRPVLLVVAITAACVLATGPRVVTAAAPASDNLGSAAVVPAVPYSNSVITTEATVQAGEPNPTCEFGVTDIGNTVWYKYTAGSSATLVADTTGSSFDTVLAVYSGPSSSPTFGALSFITCDDESGGGGTSALAFAASTGVTYYFQAGGYLAESGNLSFSLTVLSANDNLANATPALPFPFTTSTSTVGATTEAGEPSPGCELGASFIGATVWYKFTPSEGMTLTADLSLSNFDTVVAVYSGPAVNPTFAVLAFVGCDDQSGSIDTSKYTFVAAGGITYYFQVGGYLGDAGGLTFHLLQEEDADADGVPDAGDNCPYWANAAQNLPPWTVPADDLDCDGWNASIEAHVVTDPTKHCNETVAGNDEPDAWPSDFNDSQTTNLSDVILMGPSYNKSLGNPVYNARFDLNASNSVNLSDVILFGPFYNKSCT